MSELMRLADGSWWWTLVMFGLIASAVAVCFFAFYQICRPSKRFHSKIMRDSDPEFYDYHCAICRRPLPAQIVPTGCRVACTACVETWKWS